MLKKYLILVLLFIVTSDSYSLEWKRGVGQIDQIDPGINFLKYGTIDNITEFKNLPFEFSQLVKFSANNPGKLYFRLSTGIHGRWEGPGKFSIEAFDHSWVNNSISSISLDELTRTILYFEKGYLFINSNALNPESSILIEIPLGKVISNRGIFSIMLEDFEDGTRRNASIKCHQGSLVYLDRQGESFTLSSGNKLMLILKNNLFKVSLLELDPLEKRALLHYNEERSDFSEPERFPEVDSPVKNETKEDESSVKNEFIRKYYNFPLLKKINKFNPYKKLYGEE